MNSDDETLTKTQELARPDPLLQSSPAKGRGPTDLKQGNLENLRAEIHRQNSRNEGGENNNIGSTSLSTNPSQGISTNEQNTPPQESIQPNNNSTSIFPSTLKAKSMLLIGFTGLLGLLGLSYKINGNGNIVPKALFHQPAITFTLLLIIFMVFFYFATIGLALEEPCPWISKVFEIISFVFLVLGATVSLWALIPKNISWIPWIFFTCTVVVVFGVPCSLAIYRKSSAPKSTASRPPV